MNFWDDHRINPQQEPSADSLKKARRYRESAEKHDHVTIEEVQDHLAQTAESRRQRREALGQEPILPVPEKTNTPRIERATSDVTRVTPRKRS